MLKFFGLVFVRCFLDFSIRESNTMHKQNLEDETFRERRTDLRSRDLNIPFTILNKTLFEEFFEAK